MTEFFRSAQVRAALAELAEIQDDLAHTMSNPRILSDDEKKDYVKKLKLFLESKSYFSSVYHYQMIQRLCKLKSTF